MSMPELTDDQLDRLFRKSAEEFDPPFDSAAWRDMKTRLDANDRTTTDGAPIWRTLLRKSWLIGLLFLLGVGGWYWYRRANPVTINSDKWVMSKRDAAMSRLTGQSKSTAPAVKPKGKPVPTTEVDVKKTEPAKRPTGLDASIAEYKPSGNRLDELTPTRTKTGITPDAATKRTMPAYKLTSKRLRSNRLLVSKSESPTGKPEPGITRYSTRKTSWPPDKVNKAKNNQNRRILATTADKKNSRSAGSNGWRINNQEPSSNRPTDAVSLLTLPPTGEDGPVALPGLSGLKGRSAKWPTLPSLLTRPVVVQVDTAAIVQNRVPTPAVQRGLSVRFVVAPDLSAVGLKNFSRPGTNVGLLLEYRLASRWSVQVGMIQSTKVYRALPDEYNFPWNWPVDPSSIDGKCSMFDIPLNIRYDVAVRPRLDGRLPSRWFVSGGVTSYVINQENYQYNYPPHTYPKYTEFSTRTGGYGFSHLNLSVGYERALSRRLSWQVEPFMKAPLRGVGYFNINLLSTGAFFSLRYKL